MYERLSIATYATHDHQPIRALWDEVLEHRDSDTARQARATLEKIALFAGLNPKIDALDFEKDFYPAMMEAVFKCNSWIAIVMITDLLARTYRFNVPGTKANLNWTRRIQRSIAKLRSSRKEQKRMQLIHELLVKTGRV
jgi:4-alpha-glucanotransferase